MKSEKGSGFVPIIIALILASFLGLFLIEVFPLAKFLFIVIIGLNVWGLVQENLGSGMLSLGITLILMLIAIQYLWVLAPIYMFFTLLSLGIVNAIVWGVGSHKGGKKPPGK